MRKNNLTSIGFACMICFPILSIFSGIGTYNVIRTSEVDSYISVIIAFLIGLLGLGLFFLIFNYRTDLNILDKNKVLFGNILGTILNYLIGIGFLAIGVILLYNISNFAISQFLAETPLLVFMLLIGIILIYNVSLGIENISRVSIVFLAIICFLTLISTAGILSHFEMSNIKPVLEFGMKKPIQGGLSLLLTDVVPIFMLLIVEKDKVEKKEKLKKYLIFFYCLAFLFVFLAILLTVGSLGIHLSKLYQYPEYTVLKKISLFNFIERIENFIYIKWILSSFISLSLIIYYVKNTIRKKSNWIVSSLIMIILITVALTIFRNNTIFYQVIYFIFPYICLFLLCIYIIIGVNILVRKVFKI